MMAATRTFLQATSDTANSTAYTFSSQNLGAEDAGRYVVVGIAARALGSVTISGVTVGGVTATIAKQATNTTSNSDISGLVIAAVPSGTTGDIVVTFSAGALRCRIQVYRVLGIDGVTAYDSESSTASDPTTSSLDVPEDGVAFGAAVNGNSGFDTCSWTGLTEDDDANVESAITATAASDEFTSAETGYTVTADFASGIARSAGVFVSWAPAGSPPAGGNVPKKAMHYKRLMSA